MIQKTTEYVLVTPLSLMVRYLTKEPPLTEEEKDILIYALYADNKIFSAHGLAKRALDEINGRA